MISDNKYQVSDIKYQITNIKYQISSIKYQISGNIINPINNNLTTQQLWKRMNLNSKVVR